MRRSTLQICDEAADAAEMEHACGEAADAGDIEHACVEAVDAAGMVRACDDSSHPRVLRAPYTSGEEEGALANMGWRRATGIPDSFLWIEDIFLVFVLYP